MCKSPYAAALIATVALAVSLTSFASERQVLHDPPPRQGAQILDATALVEVADLGGLRVSPDGRRVAVRVDQANADSNSYQLEWRIIDLTGGETLRTISGGTPIFNNSGVMTPGEALWTPDSRALVFRALADGQVQLQRVDLNSSDVMQLTRGPSDVGRFALAEKGRVVYEVGPTRAELIAADQAEFLAGTHLGRSVNLSRPLVGGVPVNGQRLTIRLGDGPGANDRTLLGGRSPVALTVRISGGDVIPATAEEHLALNARESSVQHGALLATTRVEFTKTRRQQLRKNEVVTSRVIWRSVDGVEHRCEDKLCLGQVRVLAWSGNGREIYFLRKEKLGIAGLYAMDTLTRRARSILVTDEQLGTWRYDSHFCPISNDAAICVVESAVSPPMLVSIDLKSGRRRVLLDPNSELRKLLHTRVERLEWTSRFGDPAYGYLLMPEAPSHPRPLVIVQYSCSGFLRGGTGDEYPEQLLVEDGIAALCANAPAVENPRKGLRHPEQEGVFASHLALLDLLAKRGDIDMAHVGITGLSSGADKALYAISHSNRFSAAVVSGPTVDPITTFISGTPGHRVLEIMPIYGLPPFYLPNDMTADDRERWNEFSPALRARHIRAPLLMQIADSEAVMSMQLYASLTALQRPVDAYIYSDELHIKRHPAHRLRVYQRNVDWFAYWLLGDRDASPSKAVQYEHWDALRRLNPDSAPQLRMEYMLGPDSGSLKALQELGIKLPGDSRKGFEDAIP